MPLEFCADCNAVSDFVQLVEFYKLLPSFAAVCPRVRRY